jgi:hypothetical protein
MDSRLIGLVFGYGPAQWDRGTDERRADLPVLAARVSHCSRHSLNRKVPPEDTLLRFED